MFLRATNVAARQKLLGDFPELLASSCLANEIVSDWCAKEQIVLYEIFDNNKPVSCALLTPTDTDHTDSHIFNLIWTKDDQRQKGFASRLVYQVAQEYDFIAFCRSRESAKVFINAKVPLFGCFNARGPVGVNDPISELSLSCGYVCAYKTNLLA